ncbi:hypothetical protein FSP39_012315 [Pinctada imbricata]|uniref:Uncharacterized protein n=1 Tax=Pinctada imbricata TaxID=66713 RepID=A0AA88XL31_PINIB|nr:hypothetical protein FSP39_012315 [Pinctada imbricata]
MAEKSPVKTQGGQKKEERDGLIALWQGYHGEIEVRTFPKLSTQQVRRVAIGDDHTIFCTEGGQVYTCGSNKHGQLGAENLEVDYSADPVFVSGLKDILIKDVACGSNHCAAVSRDGQVYCWGESSHSQCGQQVNKVPTPTRVQIQNLSQDTCHHGNPLEVEEIKIAQISCGAQHTAAVSRNGEIWVWGSGKGLGIKDVAETEKPVCLQNLVNRNVISVSCGLNHTLVIVEKSVLPDDVTLTPRGSRLRSSVLDTVTHDFMPSTCAKCNAEIYSYKDLNDTCIISVDHLCDSQRSLDSSSVSQNLNESVSEKPCDTDEVFLDLESEKDKSQSSEKQEGNNTSNEKSKSESGDVEKASCKDSTVRNQTEDKNNTKKVRVRRRIRHLGKKGYL